MRMRNLKWQKSLMAVILSVVLAFSVLPVYAQEIQAQVEAGQEEAEDVYIENRMADEFQIDEYGVLVKYSGNAMDVVIPKGVTSIGKRAFSSCSRLTNISLPEGVTRIGNDAFEYCASLASIRLPDGLISIGRGAFNGCKSLISISLPESVTSIGESAFNECKSLISISLPESVTSIRESVFKGCSSLVNIILPDGVTSIGEFAFLGCSSLANVKIPESVTYIEYNAFLGCSSLTNVEIPKGVASIERFAFRGCSSLVNVKIPESVTSIGIGAFSDCSSLTGINVAEENSNYLSNNGVLYNKNRSTLLQYPGGLSSVNILDEVTSIGESAFYGCRCLTDICLPNGVRRIEENAFSDCSSLTSIDMPEDLNRIGWCAFENCSSLTSISLPEDLSSIGENAFEDCSSLSSIDLPKGLERIGANAFQGCSSLTSVDLPDSLTEIESGTFLGCNSLTGINLPKGINNIGNYAFNDCGSLENIKVDEGNTVYDSRDGCNAIIETKSNTLIIGSTKTLIPFSVTSIGAYAFGGRSGLNKIDLHEGVISIGYNAFSGCSGLTSIEIPEGVASISSGAFSGCNGLTSIKVREGNTIYDSRDNCNAIIETKSNDLIVGMANTKIPLSVTGIGSSAFEDCKNLTSIEIPSSVTYISEHAFAGCSNLASIEIPSSVKTIYSYVFSDCSNLIEVKIPSSVTVIGAYAFFGCNSLVKVEIPSSVTEIYDYSFGYFGFYNDKYNLTIYGEVGTAAEQYALQNGFLFLPASIKVEKITLSQTETALEIGQTVLLEAAITPDNAGNKQLKWSSSNPEVASVDNGLVTAIGEGSTTITAESQDGSNVSASCSITVQKSEPTPVEKENQSITGTSSYSKTYGDAPFQLDIVLEKGNGPLSYASSNPKAAEVSGTGEVKITGAGSTTVTVTASETEQFKKCEYQVFIKVAKAAQRISGKSSYSKAAGGGQFRLDAKRMSGNGSLSYLSANRTVATVSNSGMVTIKKPGNTVITVTAAATANYNACTFRIKLSVTAPKKGTTLTDSKTKARYKVTKQGKSVEYLKPKDKKVTKVSIPATVTISGVKYNVTAIASNALSGCKKLKAVTIGKNVESIGTKAFASCTALGKLTLPAKASKIGKQAFANCSKLKDIIIQSTKLTAKSIGAKAFQGIHAKATIKVPKAKRAAYQKLLKSKGIGKKVKVK